MTKARLPKLLVLGHGRHGKDTVCEILRDRFGYTFVSSSAFVGRRAVWPRCPQYATFEECYADRHNQRALWFDYISEYNSADAARLGCELFSEFDIYCGLRSIREFNALKARNAFDLVIWVDASKRHAPEPSDSCTVHAGLADVVIDNNGSLDELTWRVMFIAGAYGLAAPLANGGPVTDFTPVLAGERALL